MNNKSKKKGSVSLNLSEMEQNYGKILSGELDPNNLKAYLKDKKQDNKKDIKKDIKKQDDKKLEKSVATSKQRSVNNNSKLSSRNEVVSKKGDSKNGLAGPTRNYKGSKALDSSDNKLNKNGKVKNDRLSTKNSSKKNVEGKPCIYERKCGGCNCNDIPYNKQLQNKQKKLEALLKEFCSVKPIIGMDNPYHYRNKVHAVVSHNKGNIITGVYKAGTHIVIPVEHCLIEDIKADDIIGSIRTLMKSFKLKSYDEDTGYGFLRHILIKRGFASGEIMVVLVTSSPIFPSKNNFVKALLKLHPDITTIIHNVNAKNTSMVLGEQEKVMYGKGYIEDTLCGYVFRISSKSFYQVNPVQTEVLYNKAIELAKLTGEETVIDAYCGIGTIGIVASKAAKEVIGVELNKDAVKDAIANAKRNNVTNVDFYNSDSSEFMMKLASQGKKVDVVLLDPPRSGSTEQFIDAVSILAPSRVVYISCNPETLARDLKYFKKKGYKAEVAYGVDMFPFTEHVETVCLLSKIK